MLSKQQKRENLSQLLTKSLLCNFNKKKYIGNLIYTVKVMQYFYTFDYFKQSMYKVSISFLW